MLSALPHLVYSPGGTTAGGGVELDIVHYWSRLGVRGFMAMALLPNRYAAAEGTAEARPRLAGVQGVWFIEPDGASPSASMGAGVAVVSTVLDASAEPGYRSADDHLFTAAPIVDLRVAAPLGKRVALVAAGSVLTPLRSDRMVFAEREVARHGEVLLTVGLGAQARLP
jgi:hypothetical protein